MPLRCPLLDESKFISIHSFVSALIRNTVAEALCAMAGAESSTNTLTTTKCYPLMTINMNGDGKPCERRDLSSEIIRNNRPSLVFCQELPGYFEKDVVGKCDTYDYAVVCTEKEAAVMWNKVDFNGEPVDAALKTKIRESVVAFYNIDNDIVSEIPARTAIVKLSSKEDACNCLSALLAVSWHGPHSGTKMDKKQNVRKALFLFLSEVCRKTGASSLIIGGDFNLNTLEGNADLRELNVFFPHYELSPRGKLAKKSKRRGRPYIPYKDNFATAPLFSSFSSDTKEEKCGKAENDLLATGRPPATGTKSRPFTSPRGDTRVSQGSSLSSDAKEKCGMVVNDLLATGLPPATGTKPRPFTSPRGDTRMSQGSSLSSDAKEKCGMVGNDLLATGLPPAIGTKPRPFTSLRGSIIVSQVRALSLDAKEENCGKVGNDILDHDPITGVLQHGSSCRADNQCCFIL